MVSRHRLLLEVLAVLLCAAVFVSTVVQPARFERTFDASPNVGDDSLEVLVAPVAPLIAGGVRTRLACYE
jgi:hypothetical protein